MSINFTPKWGAILICDFERAFVLPEMRKTRRVIVISDTQHNTWSARDPGTCTVVPLSATPPRGADTRALLIPAGSYASLTRDVWVKCGMIDTVSNARLSQVRIGQRYQREAATKADMLQIQACIRKALSL